jgi:hypothetical protein
MDRFPTGTLLGLAVVSLLVDAFGHRLSMVTAVVTGQATSPIALAVLRYRTYGSVSFREALATVVIPVAGAVAVDAPVGNIVDWGGPIGIVFPCGIGLAVPLGVARDHRQQSIIVAVLALLVALFVAAAVHD